MKTVFFCVLTLAFCFCLEEPMLEWNLWPIVIAATVLIVLSYLNEKMSRHFKFIRKLKAVKIFRSYFPFFLGALCFAEFVLICQGVAEAIHCTAIKTIVTVPIWAWGWVSFFIPVSMIVGAFVVNQLSKVNEKVGEMVFRLFGVLLLSLLAFVLCAYANYDYYSKSDSCKEWVVVKNKDTIVAGKSRRCYMVELSFHNGAYIRVENKAFYDKMNVGDSLEVAVYKGLLGFSIVPEGELLSILTSAAE